MAAVLTEPTAAVDAEPVRWPLQPLLDVCGYSRRYLSHHAGVSSAHVQRAGQRGLTDTEADEWAIRAGLHPALVWGEAWFAAAGDVERLALDRPAHVRVAATIRRQIDTGELAPGDPLPMVDELAVEAGVGRSVAAKALADLTADGLTVTRNRRRHVAGPAPLSPAPVACSACGEPIEPDAEHYPHEEDCAAGVAGWCACHQPVHPECCPSCEEAAR